jgi:hypothetical protein
VERRDYQRILRLIRSQSHHSLVRYLGAGKGAGAAGAAPGARDGEDEP